MRWTLSVKVVLQDNKHNQNRDVYESSLDFEKHDDSFRIFKWIESTANSMLGVFQHYHDQP